MSKHIVTLVVLITAMFSGMAAQRESLWKAVEDAARQGLPRTAITNLDAIVSAALAEQSYPEAALAIGRRAVLRGSIEGGRAEERLQLLQKEIETAPGPMKPMLEALLAHWYWSYFRENRWRFLQRTTTQTAPGDDFQTWDLPRIYAEIDKHFTHALAAHATLKQVAARDWEPLLRKGTMDDVYRPTLYDFIAHEALAFYASGEQAGARRMDAFELSADSAAFGPTEEFIGWTPTPGGDENSPLLRALRLHQDLLKFHAADPTPRLAYALADLDRLAWAYNAARGEEKTARYRAALQRFIDEQGATEPAALACEQLARLLYQEQEFVRARELALRGASAAPQSPAAALCSNIISSIEAKSADIDTERVWNAPWPDIDIRYRNLNVLHFRAIPYDWDLFLERRRNRPENLNSNERREVLAKPAALAWSVQLPPTQDYKERKFKAKAPATLKPGFYFIAASAEPGFGEENNVVWLTDVFVSELALVTRTREQAIEGFVMEAGSGIPLSGAEIAVWHLSNQGTRVADPQLRTDEHGFFSFRPTPGRPYLVRARHNGRELATFSDTAVYDQGRAREGVAAKRTVFFTDRGLYRPGQAIRYKGICILIDTARNNYEVLKRESVTVVFSDANGQEIGRQRHMANDYGSFSGSFTAPRGRLNGAVTLSVGTGAQGATQVQVEEYKRPRFAVEIDPPAQAPRLNGAVKLSGRAETYTGAPVDGAPYTYRVTRQTRLPIWRMWGPWMPGFGEAQEIASGAGTLSREGTFALEFTAKPDTAIAKEHLPVFTYVVSVDVTDSSGETRAAHKEVRIGYAAIEATLAANEWQTQDNPVEVRVKTESLDNLPRPSSGTVKIYALQAPAKVYRPPLGNEAIPLYRRGFAPPTKPQEASDDMSDPANWPLGAVVAERPFSTGTNGLTTLSVPLKAGAYRAVLESKDSLGENVRAEAQLLVLNTNATKFPVRIPHYLEAKSWEVRPGELFVAVWGTGYDSGRAFVEVEHRARIIRSFWTDPARTQQSFEIPVNEEMRGGFVVRVTYVRENRCYAESKTVMVPWENKHLNVRLERFRSRLQPGAEETWTLVVSGPTNSTDRFSDAELAATLYDASLDAFMPFSWIHRIEGFYQDQPRVYSVFQNVPKDFRYVAGRWNMERGRDAAITFRTFAPELLVSGRGNETHLRFARRYGLAPKPAAMEADASMATVSLSAAPADSAGVMFGAGHVATGEVPSTPSSPAPDLDSIAARRNLSETAFFFPHLTSDSNGVVRLTFTMPDALTKWRFLAFAHDKKLRSGSAEETAITSKDLMVQPNAPRFLREGDTVEFPVKVINRSDRVQTGRVRLTFADLTRERPADGLLGNQSPERTFEVPAGESRSFFWRIHIPDGCGPLSYVASAAAANVSDGEQGAVPVIPRRILVTESLPLPIRGAGRKTYEFASLKESAGSQTIRHQSLTLQMVSNPAWYAVMALPYLMEYPHQCSEQVFNRCYANALARSLAQGNPAIRRVFDAWKGTQALESPLEKNAELKAMLLEETPWVRDAQKESEARRSVGVLFDDNRLDDESRRALAELREMQLHDGSWPWFPGGPENRYITLYIASGFGRLRHLGIPIDTQMALRAWNRLDEKLRERYEHIRQSKEPEQYVPDSMQALHLYGRSFFLKDAAVAEQNRPAIRFFLEQARKHWTKMGRQSQGHAALALQRFAEFARAADPVPRQIVASLKERSVTTEEMGMFWRDQERSWWWHAAPIETHALMIEVFAEVAQDAAAVEELKVWLLKQKQTRNWKTTKATADACYALLARGTNILANKELVHAELGGLHITPGSGDAGASANSPEPGTGFYEVRFAPQQITPALGSVTLSKQGDGVAWGALHWQYFEDMSKVEPFEGTPLKLSKTLFRKKAGPAGTVLEKVAGPLSVGDEVVARIELRVDRDMEYVHLKDYRGSGTEPANVLSGYRYQDGLAYYESTRDVASHFFIDYLPRGVYVFEYSSRVQLKGAYQTGTAEIMCMYAPEFNSHSQSIALQVN